MGVCVSKVSELYIIARCSSNKRKTKMRRGEREREREIRKGKSEGKTKFWRENEFVPGNQT